MFTYHYAQPNFYRFSLDSIQLAKFVADRLRSRPDLPTLHVLDLCAGCGVIGFELSWHLPDIRTIDFVEVQSIYTDYFWQNVNMINRKELQLNWHLSNYDALLKDEWNNKYDLIISNPPYFHPHQGVLSPSMEKNRCRFFIDSNFQNYISAIVNSLKRGGEAYILLRSLSMYGEDTIVNLNRCITDKKISASILTNLRGTHVALIKKHGSD